MIDHNQDTIMNVYLGFDDYKKMRGLLDIVDKLKERKKMVKYHKLNNSAKIDHIKLYDSS